jgi:uncharacterized protein
MSTTAISMNLRLDVLDVLRGFAVGGILLANILWLSGFLLAPGVLRESLLLAHPLDEFFLFFTRLWVPGKFYSIFSFLFGLGFAVQMLQSQKNSKQSFAAQYSRRLMVLFLIGWAHAYFVWWGDTLRFYALIGVFLLLFRQATDRTILAVAVAALLVPVLIAILHDAGWLAVSTASSRGPKDAQSLAVLAHGDWARFRDYNLGRIALHAIGNLENGRLFKILGLFLFGFFCGRSGFFQNIESRRTVLWKVLIWGSTVGIAATLLRLADIYAIYRGFASDTFNECLYLFAVYPLAAAYIALVALGLMHGRAKRWLRTLAPVGKLALSNYIFQSIACAAAFYWWGAGHAGSLPLRYCYALAMLIILFQIVFSAMWLKRFNYGPLEWVWRILTRLEWVALAQTERMPAVQPKPARNPVR